MAKDTKGSFHIMDDLNDDIQASIEVAKENLAELNNLNKDFAVPESWTADMGEQMIKMYKNINNFNKAAEKIVREHQEFNRKTKLV